LRQADAMRASTRSATSLISSRRRLPGCRPEKISPGSPFLSLLGGAALAIAGVELLAQLYR
jgi:hypothetical protein